MEDIQRELEAMDNQETPLTPEQEARQQQLSEQQKQIQQRAQEAMETQGQGDGQGDEQAQAGGAESDREIRELWLDAIRAMNNRPGTRERHRFPVTISLCANSENLSERSKNASPQFEKRSNSHRCLKKMCRRSTGEWSIGTMSFSQSKL